MTLLLGFLGYFLKFIAYCAIAVCGILVGKKLRERKDAKKITETGEE
ncbi:MAG: hypothetical protein IJ744_07825 [Lachnospiraceae bacterium]|nr:hypothetical protein [Lachnospiraceae bacterium]